MDGPLSRCLPRSLKDRISSHVALATAGRDVADSLLRTTRPAIATSYAYVNPMVALGLGTVLGGEGFTSTKLVACLLTITGVLVVSAPRKRSSA